jgi:hypothetical protein
VDFFGKINKVAQITAGKHFFNSYFSHICSFRYEQGNKKTFNETKKDRIFLFSIFRQEGQ